MDEIQIFHIKFLYSLHLFYEELEKEINGSKNVKSSLQEGYMINHQLIDTFKKIYYYEKIKYLFKKENKIDEIIQSLENDYIKKVKSQNVQILNEEKLFKIQIQKYNNLELKYFLNCNIMDSKSYKILYENIYFNNKPEISSIFYFIINKKIILTYEFVINIGILKKNNIFESEILILCSGKESFNSIIKDINILSIENFSNQVNIEQKNIGKYKGNNVVVFINTNYIPIKKIDDNKKNYVGNNTGQIFNKVDQKMIQMNQVIDDEKFKINEKNPDKSKNSNYKGEMSLEKMNVKSKEISLDYYIKDEIFSQYQELKGYVVTNQHTSSEKQNIQNTIEKKNYFNQELQKKNQNINIQKEEIEQKKERLKKEQQLENLIYLMIDLEKTNMKIKDSLKEKTDFEKYYLINCEWIKEYLEIKSKDNIFYNIEIKEKIKTMIRKNFDKTDKEILKLLKSEKVFNQSLELSLNSLKFLDSPIQSPIEPQIGNTNKFGYYFNFLLISEKIANNIIKFYTKKTPFDCLLGDNFVIILFNKSNCQMYDLKEGQYSLKMVFYFYEKRHLIESIQLLKEHHLENYKKYFTSFNEDYVSPIFNKENDEVGTVFLFNYGINDYSAYMVSDELKALIILYFNYIRINLKKRKERNGKYILINPELINAYKKYYNYAELEIKLNKINFVQDIIKNINNGFNDFRDVLSDKNIYIIIKHFIWEMNQNFLKKGLLKTNIEAEPIIEEIKGKSYFYYKKFELIDHRIYEILINNEGISSNLYQRDCTFENNYIYFEVPGNFCHNNNPRNIEICILNNDNSFSGNFLMRFYLEDGLKKLIEITGQKSLDKIFSSNQNNIIKNN